VRRILREIATFLSVTAALAASVPAAAGIVADQIRSVEAAPGPDAALPLGLRFRDETGRQVVLGDAAGGVPAVLIFADYTCRTLCGPILEFVAAGLAKTGLKPGADYRLVVIGIDPRDDIAAARAMRSAHIGDGSALGAATTFLTGSDAELRAVTHAAGLRYYYDAGHDQFAHPAAAYVLDAGGRVQRVLSPLALDGTALRLAIVDAAHGAVGGLSDRIHLLCYGYDPVKGIYTERITELLSLSAGVTLVVMIGGISLMIAREKRSRPS
jgi:protein SCO1/2